MKFLSLFLLFSSLIVLLIDSNSKINKHTIPKLNKEELLGSWYEIARFDNRFERGMVNVTATYTLLKNGKIRVENRGVDSISKKEKIAVGRAKFTSTPGRLRVSFFWIFYSDYNILEMAPNKEWMLVGSSSPKYLWILSRKPEINSENLTKILDLARQRGYDTDKLIFTQQKK